MNKSKMQCTISPTTPMYIDDASNQFTIHFQKYEAAQSKQDTPHRKDGDARIYVVPALGTDEKALCTKEEAQNIVFDLTSGYSGCTMRWEDSDEGCFFVSIPDYAPDKEFTATFRTRSFRTTAREGITDLLVSIRGFEDIEDTDMVLSLTKCYPIKMEYLKTTPECVELGQPYMLSWKVLNACYCTIDGEQVNTEGSNNYNAESPVQHRLLANNQFGAVAGVEVWVEIKPPLILEFSCDKKRFNPGDTVTASYSVSSANSISLNPEIGSLTKLKDEISMTPTHTQDYVLTAYGYDGKLASAVSKTINVIKADNRWELLAVASNNINYDFTNTNKIVSYKQRYYTYSWRFLVSSTTLTSWEHYKSYDNIIKTISIYNNMLIVGMDSDTQYKYSAEVSCEVIDLDTHQSKFMHKFDSGIPFDKMDVGVLMVNEDSIIFIYNDNSISCKAIQYIHINEGTKNSFGFRVGDYRKKVQFAVLNDKIYAAYNCSQGIEIYCNDYKNGSVDTWTLVNKTKLENFFNHCLVKMFNSIYLVTDLMMQDILKEGAKAELLPTVAGEGFTTLVCEGDKLRIMNWNINENKYTLIWEYINEA